MESHREAAEAKRLQLDLEVPDEARAFVDPIALDIVVGNLLDNAIKYTPEGGQVRVRAAGEGAFSRIEVEDTGPGIEEPHLDRLFERFYRVDAGRSREVGGTGLGLSIAKHAAQQSQGDLEVHSRPGKGSRFVLRLPSPKLASD